MGCCCNNLYVYSKLQLELGHGQFPICCSWALFRLVQILTFRIRSVKSTPADLSLRVSALRSAPRNSSRTGWSISLLLLQPQCSYGRVRADRTFSMEQPQRVLYCFVYSFRRQMGRFGRDRGAVREKRRISEKHRVND